MAEVGVDISGHQSQHIDEFKDVDLDVVVTVCDHAHESCPIFPGQTRVVHVGFPDPPQLAAEVEGQEEKLDCYRRVRDEIRDYVERFLEGLVTESVPTRLQIYDPAMCCSTGVCGPSVDDKLVALAGFLKALDETKFEVERYNLAQQPAAYTENPVVAATLKDQGTDALPMFFVNGELVHAGTYPTVDRLATLLQTEPAASDGCGGGCCAGGCC